MQFMSSSLAYGGVLNVNATTGSQTAVHTVNMLVSVFSVQ